jgi:hypothetical protein
MKRTIVLMMSLVFFFFISCLMLQASEELKDAKEPEKAKEAQETKEPQATQETKETKETKEPAKKDEFQRKWSHFFETNNRVRHYYDEGAITRTGKNFLTLWRKREFPSRMMQKEIITFEEINCKDQKFRTLKTQVVYRDDKPEAFEKTSPWATIFADSPEEWYLDNVCEEKKDKDKDKKSDKDKR